MKNKDLVPIKGFKGYYINKQAEVFSFWEGKRGKKLNYKKPPHEIKPHFTKGSQSRRTVNLGTQRNYFVARLLLQTFRPLKNYDDMWACHEDNNSLNDTLENLKWKTRSGNMIDRRRNNTYWKVRGTKLNPEKVKDIRVSYEKGASFQELAKRYSISTANISVIVRWLRWKYEEKMVRTRFTPKELRDYQSLMKEKK